MKTLIDGRSYQAALHMGAMRRPQHTGRRLNEFLAMVEEALGEPARISDLCLTAERLAGVDLLVILTRRRDDPAFRFSPEEHEGIDGHLTAGGALLLMTNHAPFAENDRKLIAKIAGPYGVSVHGRTGFRAQSETWVGAADIGFHAITELVSALYFRNSHILTCRPHESVSILATIPGLPAPNNVFALAIDGTGRIVLAADSGFIADESNEPDTGYINCEDNRRFIRQSLEWLCDKR